MKRNQRLTRKELEDLGVLELLNDGKRWGILRLWWKCGARGPSRTEDKKIKKEIWEKKSKSPHVYASDKYYPIIVFSKGPKEGGLCVAMSRLVYAWVYGEVPEGYVVDHINNDPFDNRPENLQLLTDKENNIKRFSDNGKKCFNQYHNNVKK